MKSAFVFFSSLAIGVCPLAAQGTSPAQPSYGASCISTMDKPCPVPPPSCPVSMQAQHLSDGSLVKTAGAHPKGIGQWIHLTFTGPDSKQVTSAQLTVRGATPEGRIMKAKSARSGDSDESLSLNASFSAGPSGTALADVWVAGITAVKSIELQSAVYSDGSVWQAHGATCRVTPDLLMQVTSR